jgi:hypothetical protein
MKNYKTGIVAILVISIAFLALPISRSSAVSPTVGLGTAVPFAVLAYSGITNTGTTTITGDVGSFPTPSEAGFGTVTITGTNYPGGAPSTTQTDLSGAITQAMGYAPTTIISALDSQALVAGVYSSASGALTLSGGVLTLNGQGDSSSVWIFQAPQAIAGALSTTGGTVALENGADSCNVFWVTSAGGATIGTSTTFVGTIMAYSSVTLATGASLQGAALANTGDVTMQGNTISTACVTAPITSTTSATSANTSTCTDTSGGVFVPAGANYTNQYGSAFAAPGGSYVTYFFTGPQSDVPPPMQQGSSGVYGAYNGEQGWIVSWTADPACSSSTTTTSTTTTAPPSCVYLTVVSETSNGTTLTGESNDIWNNQSQTQPTTTCVLPNTIETVGVFDVGNYAFSHWLDTGSALRFRTFSIATNTTFTAIYASTNLPTPSTDSIISVGSVNSSGASMAGFYTTLWLNGVLNQSCFTSCSFTVSNGQTYQVAVADFGNFSFNHWTDGTTNRFHTVSVGGTSSTISLVAVYAAPTATAAPASALPRSMAQVMAVQAAPSTVMHTSAPWTFVEVTAIFAALALLIGVSLRRSSSRTIMDRRQGMAAGVVVQEVHMNDGRRVAEISIDTSSPSSSR